MFPKNFLWGATTSSHQIEGSNFNNDWWEWEQKGRTKDPSGDACRSYTLYEKDFDLAQQLNHNAHRLSIEWSRIEPAEGKINQEELRHYKKVIAVLKARGIEPIVTVHHFTNPGWFSYLGGWLNDRAHKYFSFFIDTLTECFKDDVRYWITINEPMVLAWHSYHLGVWPPGEKSFLKMWRALNNMLKAHNIAYQKIHKVYQKRTAIKPMVGIATNLRPFYVCPKTNNMPVHVGVFFRHRMYNMYSLDKIKRHMDFIGVNYYEGEYNSSDPELKLPYFGGNCTYLHGHNPHANQLGWHFDPNGLYETMKWLKKYKRPIFITENGTCEEDDSWRIKFIDEHLKRVEKAIAEGINVIGYLHWSLLDNFEWHHGFAPRFGLIEVDYKTYERRIKPSALHLARIIKAGKV
ncbi:MAG TPA: glycoside hydrolase family 1 protein [Candidatus Omnitrophota bacterium]|nr:glycoside hydrolase family 1 protein [Candidatus Omnitrophota bacterium]